MFEHRLLIRIACMKSVDAIRGKAAGKIAPIIRIVTARHGDLITVVKLGRSARRHDERLRHLQSLDRSLGLVHEPLQIVIANQWDQNIRIRI